MLEDTKGFDFFSLSLFLFYLFCEKKKEYKIEEGLN